MAFKRVQILKEIHEHIAGAPRRLRAGIIRELPEADAASLEARGLAKAVKAQKSPPAKEKAPEDPDPTKGKATE